MTDAAARALYERVFDLAPASDPRAALALGDEAWPAMQQRDITPHDAETCRLLFLSAATLGELETMWLWRVRALHRFATLGWGEGVAAVMLANALSVLSEANDDYRLGRTLDVVRGSEIALRMLGEMEPFGGDREPDPRFAISDRAPSPRLVQRWYWEHRALLELVLGRFAEANHSFAVAETAAADARGRLKVRAWRVLLRIVADGDAEGAAEAELASLRGPALELGAGDLVEVIDHDLAVLRAGRRDLRPFAIL